MRSGKRKYSVGDKRWKCALRNYKCNKYNCLQVLGGVNSKRPERNNDIDDFPDKMIKK